MEIIGKMRHEKYRDQAHQSAQQYMQTGQSALLRITHDDIVGSFYVRNFFYDR